MSALKRFRSEYTLSLLFLAYFFASISRFVITAFVEPIKHDLVLSDVRISVLLGFAFSTSYVIGALPFGYLSDRISRKNLIAGGIAFWSVACMASGFAHSFDQLFWTRMATGAGEAVLMPATFSLMRDLFPPKRLARAMGFFVSAAPLGSGASLLFGATALSVMANTATRSALGLGGLAPWQAAYVLVGVPGVVLALIFFLTTTEPARGGQRAEAGVDGAPARSGYDDNVAPNWMLYAAIIVTGMFVAMFGFAFKGWIPSYLTRSHGLSVPHAGLYYGLITVFVSPIGTILSGFICDGLQRRDIGQAPARLLRFCFAAAIPAAAIAFLLPSTGIALTGIVLLTLAYSMQIPLAPLVLQLTSPKRLIGRTTGIYLVVYNFLGASIGPLSVASLASLAAFQPIGRALFANSVLAAVLGLASTSFAYWAWRGTRPSPDGAAKIPVRSTEHA
ncbi:MAG: MFS transporter [Rhizomicrobium sp.]